MFSALTSTTLHIPHTTGKYSISACLFVVRRALCLVRCVIVCAFLTSLLPNLLLERPDIALYPLHRTLQRVDVLGEQLVADAVLVDHVVVHAGAGGRGAEQEAEESIRCQISIPSNRTLHYTCVNPLVAKETERERNDKVTGEIVKFQLGS
jgi:hypothetical protein